MPQPFYHFTAAEYLGSIRLFGLSKGDVPISPNEGQNGVWLTTDPTPQGHGLTAAAHVLTLEERQRYQKAFGVLPAAGTRFPNKMAVRITINSVPPEGQLVRWFRWGRKNCKPGWYETMVNANGARHRTWYVYFGVIPPDYFAKIEHLEKIP